MENEGNNHEHGHCGNCKTHWRHRGGAYHHHSFAGGIWLIGWLFAIGYLKLAFWQGLLALILWPYYLGAALSLVQ